MSTADLEAILEEYPRGTLAEAEDLAWKLLEAVLLGEVLP